MSEYQNNSIFWVEVEKIGPNPFQPRREFNQHSLEDLADSIRQYGILQPLVVTRKEEQNEYGVSVFYELIAGERRLRASRIAGLQQVPVIIRKETNDKVKLELAIIENLQREDLNPIDRALAFEQLYKQFDLTHADIGKKMGKSRVYVSNSLRLLSLPDDMKQGLMSGRITEGHTRPLLMLSDKPEEQSTLYREIMLKKMSVRESEKIARSIAQDRVRKKKFVVDPRIRDFEKRLSDNLGTRVHIEQKEKGGKITIDYFSVKDLEGILSAMNKVEHESGDTMMDSYVNQQSEISSQNVLSQSGPINFISGEITTNILKKDISNVENIPVPVLDTPIQNPVNNINSSLPEIKKLNEYVHHAEEEIVKYKEALPEYVHKVEEEIVVHKNSLPEYHTQSDENINVVNQYKNTIPEKIVEDVVLPVVENIVDQGQHTSEVQQEFAQVENPVSEQYQDSRFVQKDILNDIDNNQVVQVSQQDLVQNPASGNFIPEPHYVQQNTYQGEEQTYQNTAQYQNQSQNYQYQQPKKKGFFGRIFS